MSKINTLNGIHVFKLNVSFVLFLMTNRIYDGTRTKEIV